MELSACPLASSERSLACVFSKTALSDNREELDYLLGVSVFYHKSAAFVFRTAFYVFLKKPALVPEKAGERNFIKSVPLLELLEITAIFMMAEELKEAGYRDDDFIIPVTVLEEKSFYKCLRSYTDVIML
jgi:sulfur relay (sulfurtransferase) DsrF/TusC family protein